MKSCSTKPLQFISDKLLEQHCRLLLDKIQKVASSADEELYSNVIDPFSATFDAMYQKISLDDWLRQEKARQIQKSLQNYVGDFHQAVLGSINGWENLGIGNSIDLRSRDRKIIAEVKNKHNTMNSNSALAVYDKLQKHLDYDESYQGYTAYCVIIIPQTPKPINFPFCPSERGIKRPQREDIRKVDGMSFYNIATNNSNALQELYCRIPVILGRLLNINIEKFVSTGIFDYLFQKAYLQKNENPDY